ncbi:MAG: hypothetical protein ACRDIY_04475 [Chloroflexota bacterium]
MATDIARELEDQLVETKSALQGQAEQMLDLLRQFEAQLQARLDAAEAQIAAYRASTTPDLSRSANRLAH